MSIIQEIQKEQAITTTRRKKEPVDYKNLGVVEQIRVAFKPENRLATFAGFLFGAIIPIATYVLTHYEITSTADFWGLLDQPIFYLIVGGLLYSFSTVFYFGRLAFDSRLKSFGFTLLIEGTMTLAHTPWLSITALCYLIIINGIGTGVILALYKKEQQ
jgi:VIT1/CCC1 family predicted Fe2+/Mn2+ transporter